MYLLHKQRNGNRHDILSKKKEIRSGSFIFLLKSQMKPISEELMTFISGKTIVSGRL